MRKIVRNKLGKQEIKTVPQLKNESPKQYLAFLLYCETKSIDKLWRDMAAKGHQNGDKIETVFGTSEAIPAKRTLERWSSKFQWKKRKEKQTAYFVKNFNAELRERRLEHNVELAREVVEVLPKVVGQIKYEDKRRYNGNVENFKKGKNVGK